MSTYTIEGFHGIDVEVEVHSFNRGQSFIPGQRTVSPPDPPDIDFTVNKFNIYLELGDDGYEEEKERAEQVILHYQDELRDRLIEIKLFEDGYND